MLIKKILAVGSPRHRPPRVAAVRAGAGGWASHPMRPPARAALGGAARRSRADVPLSLARPLLVPDALISKVTLQTLCFWLCSSAC